MGMSPPALNTMKASLVNISSSVKLDSLYSKLHRMIFGLL